METMKSSRCLCTPSMMRPASGRAVTVPIWKQVMAIPASHCPSPRSSMMYTGREAIKMYCDMK